jgi:dihydrofolate reductase
MGRKTWDSLSHKPLKNRHNVVISSTLPIQSDFYCETNYLQIIPLKHLIKGITHMRNEDIFIIGGGSIY